jgi:hypothetical protein
VDNLIDTLINLFVFAYIGLLVWLYYKDTPVDEKQEDNDQCRNG